MLGAGLLGKVQAAADTVTAAVLWGWKSAIVKPRMVGAFGGIRQGLLKIRPAGHRC